MFRKQIIATALLGTIAAFAHGSEAPKKDPKTGKNCVTFMSSEAVDNALVRMNFRNTCDSPFEIRIPVGQNTRKKSIEAGSSEKPTKAFVTCRSSDACETAKWLYE
jgi:hypothetical protein